MLLLHKTHGIGASSREINTKKGKKMNELVKNRVVFNPIGIKKGDLKTVYLDLKIVFSLPHFYKPLIKGENALCTTMGIINSEFGS